MTTCLLRHPFGHGESVTAREQHQPGCRGPTVTVTKKSVCVTSNERPRRFIPEALRVVAVCLPRVPFGHKESAGAGERDCAQSSVGAVRSTINNLDESSRRPPSAISKASSPPTNTSPLPHEEIRSRAARDLHQDTQTSEETQESSSDQTAHRCAESIMPQIEICISEILAAKNALESAYLDWEAFWPDL